MYDVTNLDTKRDTTFRSAAKFRRSASPSEVAALLNRKLGENRLMERTWTLTDEEGTEGRIYRGFNKNFNPIHLELVAILLQDGEIDMYALEDSKQARSSFVRYVADELPESVVVAGIYRRGK